MLQDSQMPPYSRPDRSRMSGIPKSFMMHVDKDEPGARLTPSGHYVMPKIDKCVKHIFTAALVEQTFTNFFYELLQLFTELRTPIPRKKDHHSYRKRIPSHFRRKRSRRSLANWCVRSAKICCAKRSSFLVAAQVSATSVRSFLSTKLFQAL